MKIKVVLFISILFSCNSYSQLRYEGQAFGSNFIGYTLNVEELITLNSRQTSKIGLGFGGGFGGQGLNFITRASITYYYKNWGIGGESSVFLVSPFSNSLYVPDLEWSIYPNLNYTLNFKKKQGRYIKFSAGILLPFGRYIYRNEIEMGFLGDPIPMIGVSFGNVLLYQR